MANHNPDAYYNRTEVSNSDLTALRDLLHPRLQFGDREAAFRFGTLVDAIITEPDRVNYYQHTVDDVLYSGEEFRHAQEMHKALRMEAKRDRFLAYVLDQADTQRVSVRHGQPFEYGCFPFTLDTRCKWDWWIPGANFGGDLKTTSAASQQEFEESIDFFDWDRSRAWYMDIEGTEKDFIFAISKKNNLVFKKLNDPGDEIYTRGREKYEELAFWYWCLNLNTDNPSQQ